MAKTLRLKIFVRNVPVGPHKLACGKRTQILLGFHRRVGDLLRAGF